MDGRAGAARIIETEHLRLRPHAISDYEAVVALWGEPEVHRPITGIAPGREEMWHKLLRFAGHWALLGYGMYVAEDRTTGTLMGEVGLADFHRGLGPGFDGFPEAAWVMGPWATGRGLAAEAMTAVLAAADAAGIGRRVVCVIDPANVPSVGLAGRLGFLPFGDAVYRERAVRLFARTLPQPA
ncbi:MAG: GNAT family N-acetyltransferase [Sphingomonas fennica]